MKGGRDRHYVDGCKVNMLKTLTVMKSRDERVEEE